MDPAPLCKTAILSFIIDETLPKFLNLSSISRKRAQMVVGDRHVVVREYNESALKINGWVKVGKKHKDIERIQDIKKGVSNYELETQEQADKVISLNGKLRCSTLSLRNEIFTEVDDIQCLSVDSHICDLFLKHSFNKIRALQLKNLSSSQIKEILSKIKQIYDLKIENSSISNLSLSSMKIRKIEFRKVIFSGEVYLPSNLHYLKEYECENANCLKINKIIRVGLYNSETKSQDLADQIKNCEGLKEADIYTPLSKSINYFPSTIRKLGYNFDIDLENIDLAKMKEKVPFLIIMHYKTPVEMAQTLNLRVINSIITEAKEKFTLRPRKIMIFDENVEQLNKHPELFEKVQKVEIYSGEFNFDCLTERIREIYFDEFEIEEDKLESFKRNSWKFENTYVRISNITNKKCSRKILNSLKKVRKIQANIGIKSLAKNYAQFEFSFK